MPNRAIGRVMPVGVVVGGRKTGPEVGRGLFRAIRHMVDGDYREAGVETLAALAAPALMSYASTASLVMEVVGGAYSLANPAMGEAEVPRFAHRKAA